MSDNRRAVLSDPLTGSFRMSLLVWDSVILPVPAGKLVQSYIEPCCSEKHGRLAAATLLELRSPFHQDPNTCR